EVRHYGYVLKMLKEISAGERVESRGEPREYCLGVILFHNAEGRRGRAYCVNLSKTGICLEGECELGVGSVWGLEIQLFGKPEALCHRGKIVWSKKVEEHFYIHGIAFEL
ncbi:MAG: PilZ domain-containing protein, partial [Candidatus Omnitrophica bacterium]|nr:PilZ domain-containing protein [Candidatus Omnitrophota bacterium]